MQIPNPIESFNNLRRCRVDDGVYTNEGEIDKVNIDVKNKYALFKIIELITESNNTVTNKLDLMKNLKTITNNCNPIIDKIINSKLKPLLGVVQSSPGVVQSSPGFVKSLPVVVQSSPVVVRSVPHVKVNKEEDEKDYLIKELDYTTHNAKYIDIFRDNNLLDEKYIIKDINGINGINGIIFRLYYNSERNFKAVYLNKTKENKINIIDAITRKILDDDQFKNMTSIQGWQGMPDYQIDYFESIKINNETLAEEYKSQYGGVLSKNKGKKGVYKSTKQKVSVIIDKKHYNKTVYKNSKGISYIRRNNEYKLLKKYKLSKL